ncbi:MAG: 3-deoxy-D-manno-octulosonic acid transferase [Desulfovibrio sp.]|jgi:3-deoxy-D-manno-octulosonic-acid transferase|nr:3-deoxy-D-manno-octulosonic acid transferase [Desulfovibrio sp.]
MSSMLSRLFLAAYGGLWRMAHPLLRRHKRLREDFGQRLLPTDWGCSPDPPVTEGSSGYTGGMPDPASRADALRPLRLWIQAASGGEAWLVHSLVPALRESLAAHPVLADRPVHVLCTTWTRQGLHILEKLASLPHRSPHITVFPRFFPLDSPLLMQRAMALARPDRIILLETELWPGLLAAAARNGIPILALNARMTEKSFRIYRKIAFFWREHAPELVLAISPEDARRFARLFACDERMGTMPNIKFDRVAESLELLMEHDEDRSFRAGAGMDESVLLVVLASVREEEADILLPVVQEMRVLSVRGHSVAVAVAPRHMHRVDAWKARLRAAAVPFYLRSEIKGAGDATALSASAAFPSVCLWDTFGELHALYAAADAVYVGASLLPLGGQNFLEPVVQGVIPLVGPHIDNFHWVGGEIFTEGLAVMLAEGEDLRAALVKALHTRLDCLREAFRAQGTHGPDWQAARAGAAAKVRRRFAAWLRPRSGGSRQAAAAVTRSLAQTDRKR